MYAEQEDVFYYLTVMNENYRHPAMPEGAAEGILKGMYLLRPADGAAGGPKVQLMGSGTILREVIAGAELWPRTRASRPTSGAATSFTELRRDALEAERWNMLHPTETARKSWVETCLERA